MARVVEVSKEALREQREVVLDRVQLSYDEIARRAEDGSLVGAEWDAWEELRNIAFLLGDDR